MSDSHFETDIASGLQSEIGARLARLRLHRNVSQQFLSDQAGIGLRTLRRLEAGQPTSLDTFLRLLIALGLGESLLSVLPSGRINPIDRVRGKGTERQRARPKSAARPHAPWTWGDETRD